MNKKILQLLFIFSFFFLISGCTFFNKTNSDQDSSGFSTDEQQQETASEKKIPSGWKKFQSQEYPFQFHYSPDWELKGPNSGENYYNLSLEKKDSEQEEVTIFPEPMTAAYYINVNVQDNPQAMTAKQKRLSYFSEDSQQKAEAEMEEVEIDGVQGVRFQEPSAPSSGLSTMVSVVYNGKFYNFTYSALAHQETHNKYLDYFDQVLQTVKFGQ